MSRTDYDERKAAIRQALGLPAEAVVVRASQIGWRDGWVVVVTDEQADLAFNLARKLGDSATADTFVTRGEDATLVAVDEAAEFFAEPQLDVTLRGHAADRERYVTERAGQLARAYRTVESQLYRGDGIGVAHEAIFRDLIDRGVLK